MDTGEMTQRIKALEANSTQKDAGSTNVMQGSFILFNQPLVRQSRDMDKEDGDPARTNSYLICYDMKGRKGARRLLYKQLQVLESGGVTLLRNRQFIAVPGTGNTSDYVEIRDTVGSDGSKARSVGEDLAPLGNNTFTLGQAGSYWKGAYFRSATLDESSVSPRVDNTYNLGGADLRWKEVFSAAGSINTSDERMKVNVGEIPDEVLDAWGEVNWKRYQMAEAVESKGEALARFHTGLVAQEILRVFTSHGLDATRYGLLCHDEWDAREEQRDAEGNIAVEAREAGDVWGVRYAECLAMEAAYQRRCLAQIETRLRVLEEAVR